MIQHIKVKMFWIWYDLFWVYILAGIKWSFINVYDITILSKYFVKKSLIAQIKGYPMKVTSCKTTLKFIWINGFYMKEKN